MRIIVSGGGTGGHVYPAIAIIEKLRDIEPGINITYIGNKDSLEERVSKENHINFMKNKSYPYVSKRIWSKIKAVFLILISSISVYKYMRKFKPTAIITTGGYAMGPTLIAGIILGKKIYMHEQNVIPGVGNAFFSRFAKKIYVSYSDSLEHFNVSRDKLTIAGNPIRDKIASIVKIKEKKTIILSFGGSGGAEAINEYVLSLKDYISQRDDIEWIHITGLFYYEKYSKLLEGIKNLKVLDYSKDIDSLYTKADLVISRSGAITLSEISAVGICSILIPSPNVANNHQYYNAKMYEENEASFLLEEKYINTEFAIKLVDDILNDRVKRDEMAKNSKNLALLGAASLIAHDVLWGGIDAKG